MMKIQLLLTGEESSIAATIDLKPSVILQLAFESNLARIVKKNTFLYIIFTVLSILVLGYPGRLKPLFIDFILNAVEAIDNGKKDKPVLRIEILPSRDRDFYEVHFKDNGPGILPQIKNRLIVKLPLKERRI